MATQAKAGFGTRLHRGNGATPTETFTPIAECLDVTGPELQGMTEDVTSSDSPGAFVERIPTVRDGGQVTLALNFLESDSSQALLRGDLVNGAVRNFRIVLPGAQKRWSFVGIVTALGHEYPLKGKQAVDVTIEITGQPVFENHS